MKQKNRGISPGLRPNNRPDDLKQSARCTTFFGFVVLKHADISTFFFTRTNTVRELYLDPRTNNDDVVWQKDSNKKVNLRVKCLTSVFTAPLANR